MQKIGPHEYLKLRLDPVGAELDAMGATHVVVGFIESHGAIHITASGTPKEKAESIRKLARTLHEQADALSPSLLISGRG